MANPESAEVGDLLKKINEQNPQDVAADMQKVASEVKTALAGGQKSPARITVENCREAFTYVPWDQAQVDAGKEVTEALIAAAETVLRVVPESPLRMRAINGLFDARMLANAAITHRGKF